MLKRFLKYKEVQVERYGGVEKVEKWVGFTKLFYSLVVLLFVVLPLIIATIYTVQEGHQGIVKRFGKVVGQVEPGIHLKYPVADSVIILEIRTKKNVEEMPVATKEQMRSIAILSVNYSIKKSEVLDVYKKYGSLDQFESRVIDPAFREVSKAGISKFTAEENINKRQDVTAVIKASFLDKMVGIPVVIESVQYEDIQLPKKYLESIDAKQTAKNQRDAEHFKLEKQKLEAMREVNTADANRQANEKLADGNAYRTRTEAKAEAEKVKMLGEAEAEAIKAKATALKNNPLVIELTKAQQWSGVLPTHILGDSTNLLMDMRK